MEPSIVTISALVLYSEKDKGFRHRFEAHLSLLEKERYLDAFEFLPLEDIKRTEADVLPDKADLFLFVATTNLVDHDFCESEAFKRIKALHHTRQRLVVPMLYRTTASYEKTFSRIAPIPTNGKPVMDKHWGSPDDGLLELYNSLKTLSFEFRKAKDQLERAWQTAQRQHNPGAYRHFLKEHPHSKYEMQAKANVQQLTEEQLWNKARKNDSVEGYYEYLSDSPLKAHRFEAAAVIDRLERDTERNWKEIQKKNELVLYMDYYLRQPGGKYARQAKKIIDERLQQPLESAKEKNFQTQQNSLEMMAYDKLEPSEILAMNTHTRYSDQVKGRLLGLLSRRQSSQTLHAIVLLLLGIAEIWLFTKLYQPRIDQYGFVDMPTTRVLQFIVIIFINIWLLARAYIYFGHLQRDIAFLKRAHYVMQSLSVLLKVAFVSSDQDSIDTIVKFFTRIDRRVGEIGRKTILNYLLQSGQEEPKVLLSMENMMK